MLTGRETEADQMIQEFKRGLLKIQSIVSSIPLSGRKRVYFEAIHGKMKIFPFLHCHIHLDNGRGDKRCRGRKGGQGDKHSGLW